METTHAVKVRYAGSKHWVVTGAVSVQGARDLVVAYASNPDVAEVRVCRLRAANAEAT